MKIQYLIAGIIWILRCTCFHATEIIHIFFALTNLSAVIEKVNVEIFKQTLETLLIHSAFLIYWEKRIKGASIKA